MINELRTKEKNKTDRVVVRLSPGEKDYLKKYCKEKNIDLSKYIYNLIVVDTCMFRVELTEEIE